MRTFLIICTLLFASYVHAQEANGITKDLEGLDKVLSHKENATMVSAGHTNRLDTYLSQEEYSGIDLRFISNSFRKGSKNWDKQFTHEGAFDYTHNRTGNGKTLAGHYNFAFSMLKPLNIAVQRLELRIGFVSDLYLGFAYNTRNSSNNPAQGYASLSLGATALATYKVRAFGKFLPINYEVRIPMIGAMFSPAFGQSYYEIFNNGNYDNNIVLTTIAVPQFRHQFTIDYPIGKHTNLRIGYLGDYRQSKPNHLKQHTYTNSFLVGYVTNI